MKKKILAVVLLLAIAASSVFAEWYDGLKINDITYDGIVNAPTDDIKDIIYHYKGQNYSDELLAKLQNDFKNLGYFTYFYPEATKDANDSMQMNIAFHFYEVPLLKTITITGNDKEKTDTLIKESGLEIGTFYKGSELALAKKKLSDFYASKGYADVTIEGNLVTDDKTSTVAVTLNIKENKQVVIGEIGFSGNTTIASDILKGKVSSKTRSFFNNGYYDPASIEQDKQSLTDYYQSIGYVFVQIGEPELVDITKADDTFKRVKVVFPIEEGNVWSLGDVSVIGNTTYSDSTLLNLIKMKKGDVLDFSTFKEQLQAVSTLYYDNGYIYFNLIPSQIKNDETHTIDFQLKIAEGTQAKIGTISLTGYGDTQPQVYLREITMKEGDVFSRSALIKSMQNLQNTGLLSDITYDIQDTDNKEEVNIVFNLVEGGQKNVSFGATFGGTTSDFPISGFLTWSDNNFSGSGNSLSVSTTLGSTSQSLTTSYTDDYFGDIPWSNSYSLTLKHSEEDDVLQRGTGSDYYSGHSSDEAYPLGYDSYEAYEAADNATPSENYLMSYEYWRVALGYNTGYSWKYQPGTLKASTGLSIGVNRASYDDSYDPYSYLIKEYNEGWKFSNVLSLGLSWDGRDLISGTTKGYLLSQTFSYAGGILGGLSNYIKSATSASVYHKIGEMKINGQQRNFIASFSSSMSFMLPQYVLSDGSWNSTAQEGATSSEMLYIDGMTTALGHDSVTDQAFLFDNKLSVETTVISNLLAWDTFISATTVKEYLADLTMDPTDYTWYYAIATGLKIKIASLPIGLYLVKDATWDSSDGLEWQEGSLFDFGDDILNGMSLVLSISTNYF